MKSVLLLPVLLIGMSACADAQIFKLNSQELQNIPNIKSGTATVAFEGDPGQPALPSYLLTTVNANGTFRANGQGAWKFHDELLSNPYAFKPSQFGDQASLVISIMDVPLNADRFQPTDYTYLIGQFDNEYYAFGLIWWEDSQNRPNLRMPAAYSMLIDPQQDQVLSVVNFGVEGSTTVLSNSSIPEPGTGSAFLAGSALMLMLRRRLARTA